MLTLCNTQGGWGAVKLRQPPPHFDMCTQNSHTTNHLINTASLKCESKTICNKKYVNLQWCLNSMTPPLVYCSFSKFSTRFRGGNFHNWDWHQHNSPMYIVWDSTHDGYYCHESNYTRVGHTTWHCPVKVIFYSQYSEHFYKLTTCTCANASDFLFSQWNMQFLK